MADLETKVTIKAFDEASPTIDDVAKAASNLNTKLNQVSQTSANTAKSSSRLIVPLKGIAIAAAAAGAAIFGSSISAANAARDMKEMSERTGISIASYQKLANAVLLL